MKVKVNRALSAGRYHINFEVGEFSQDEIKKMGSFGVPGIKLLWVNANGVQVSSVVPINQISRNYDAIFPDEEAAKNYENGVLDQMRSAMQSIRERQDKFSSSEEVAL